MFNYPQQNGYLSAVPYYPPRMYQPQPMAQPAETMAPMAAPGLIKVNGRPGAEAYQLQAPNSMVALFDANEDLFYIKSTDGAGYPSIKTYRFTDAGEVSVPVEEWVSRQEFNAFKTELQEAMKNVQQLVSKRKSAAASETGE